MKRVPVYLSVEEMVILKEGLDVRGASSREDSKIVNRLDELLEEEIERNTEPHDKATQAATQAATQED